MVFLSALLFSLGGVIIKYIPWPPLAINGARNFLALIILSIFLLITKHRLKFNKWILLGSISYAATTALYTIANKMTTAANAIVLQFTAPIFIILISWIFMSKRPGKRDITACIVVFSGIVCFFVDGLRSGNILGDSLSILSGVTYAVVFMSNTFPDADTLSSLFFGQLISAVSGLPFLAISSGTLFTFTSVTAILICGIFQIGCAYILLMCGLKTTPPITASLISAIEPILNPIWVALFLGEGISVLSLAGAIIVFITIVVYNISIKLRPEK